MFQVFSLGTDKIMTLRFSYWRLFVLLSLKAQSSNLALLGLTDMETTTHYCDTRPCCSYCFVDSKLRAKLSGISWQVFQRNFKNFCSCPLQFSRLKSWEVNNDSIVHTNSVQNTYNFIAHNVCTIYMRPVNFLEVKQVYEEKRARESLKLEKIGFRRILTFEQKGGESLRKIILTGAFSHSSSKSCGRPAAVQIVLSKWSGKDPDAITITLDSIDVFIYRYYCSSINNQFRYLWKSSKFFFVSAEACARIEELRIFLSQRSRYKRALTCSKS